MPEKLTIEQIMDLRNVGVILTDEWIFKNYLGWTEDQIKEHREMQLRDAEQRYNISNTEVNGLQQKINNIKYADNPELSENLIKRYIEQLNVETSKNDNK